MNITLSPELEQLILEHLNTGRYSSVDAVIQAGLLLLNESDEFDEMNLQKLQADIDVGMASLARGERYDGEAVIQELMAANEARLVAG